MPVIINRETGLAENLPDADALSALQSQTHDVPLVDPSGQDVIVPHEEAASLLSQGYTQPNSEQLKGLMDYATFSSPSQQAKTALEGAAEAATFGASTAAEVGMGIAKKEDINKRREVNPGSHMAGQAAGLIGSALTGVGEAAVLERAGQAAAEIAAPMLGRSFVGRVGTQATKAAVDNMLFQSGDEASRMFASDPHQSMETAISDIGLAGALGAGLGGAFGTTSELWKMGPGKKLEGILESVKNRSGGLPDELKSAANLEIPDEISAGFSDNEKAREAWQILQESNSSTGGKAREALHAFRKNADDELVATLGRAPEEAASISEYEVGKTAKDAMVKELESTVKPISEQYNKLEEQFKNASVNPEARAGAQNRISQMIVDDGLLKGPSEASAKLASKVMEQLNSQATAQDIRNYISGLRNTSPWGSETYQTGKQLRNILRDLQDSTVSEHVQINAPAVLGEFNATQKAWAGMRDMLDSLNDRLHVGKFGGPESFINNLKSMTPEDVIRRLSPKGDVQMGELLAKQFPAVQDIVRQNELNKVIKSAIGKEGLEVNAKKLFQNLDKLTPEMRSFILDNATVTKLDAIKTILSKEPARMNTSGTARTLDKLWKEMPASATGLAAMLMGHSGIGGYILGKVASLIGREAPDAARMAMLKFLGSSERTSAEGFKSAVQAAAAIVRGETKLNKAVSNVFRVGRDVVGEPSSKEREMLNKQVQKVATNPEQLLNIAPNVAHYMPDHASAIATVAVRNLQYLNMLRPKTEPLSPLDSKLVPSKTEEANYNRALDIAQNPLIVLKGVKDGRITLQDLTHLTAMYPSLYERMRSKLEQDMINVLAEKESIPYATRLGLSTFLMQPLDSSMAPSSINSNQIAMQATQIQNTMENRMSALKKSPSMGTTPQQSRETVRQG